MPLVEVRLEGDSRGGRMAKRSHQGPQSRFVDRNLEMAISIKNENVERAARELAARMGVDITHAIGIALQHELALTERSRGAR